MFSYRPTRRTINTYYSWNLISNLILNSMRGKRIIPFEKCMKLNAVVSTIFLKIIYKYNFPSSKLTFFTILFRYVSNYGIVRCNTIKSISGKPRKNNQWSCCQEEVLLYKFSIRFARYCMQDLVAGLGLKKYMHKLFFIQIT